MKPVSQGSADRQGLLRLLLGYLALILLAQAGAAAFARGAGPLHQHPRDSTRPVAAVLFTHERQASHSSHAAAHAQGQRHWHLEAASEHGAQLDEPSLESATLALLAACAFMLWARPPWLPPLRGRSQWSRSGAVDFRSQSSAPPRRPPRPSLAHR